MEGLLREAKEQSPEVPPVLKEQIVLEHTPLIRYIVNRIAVRLPADFTESERHLLAALTQVYDGAASDAEKKLEALVEGRTGGRLQSLAITALGVLYQGASRWDELVSLWNRYGDEVTNEEELEQTVILAEAFQDLPSPSHAFASQPARVPTDINRFGQPILEVWVNGVRKKLLLDTGASATVLTRSTVDAVGARTLSEKAALAKTSTSRRVKMWPGVVDELRLGSLTFRNHPIAVVDDDVLEIKLGGIPILRLDGIVGWPLFQQMRVEIAYDGGETTIVPSTAAVPAPRNLFWLGYPMVVACGDDGTPYFFGFDTGAAGTSLNTHMLAKAGLRAIDGGGGVRLGAGGGENVRKRIVRGATMHLAGKKYAFPKMNVSDGVKAAELVVPDGGLGSDVLQGARVIVDLPAGRFAIER